MKAKHLDLILAVALITAVVSGFATTWTKTSSPGDQYAVGMSADARIIMAVNSTTQPVISTNWGQTWATVTNGPPWSNYRPNSVAMSADGSTIIATLSTNFQTWVFITTNYGGNWTQTSVLSSNLFDLAVACSGDASKMIAGIENGPICYSTNAGVNWYPSSVTNGLQKQSWASVASSADGQHMAAIVNGGKLFFSSDFGATWAPTNLPAQSWNSVCVSGDGKWVGATSGSGTYISSSAGASWITNRLLNGNAIACSANGTKWIIAETEVLDSPVYTSSDGGMTWATNLSCGGPMTICAWGGAAVSADGCEFVATDGSVWIGHNTPNPQLNIQAAGGNVILSWLLPSTNFVLQQNSGLGPTSWVAVTNLPTLNFSSLQYQVSLPASPDNSYFRLITQ